jgi:Short C-terminal domain
MKFTASRLSSDNKIFPSEILLDSSGVTIKIPGFFSGETTHFDYNHIVSVEIDTPLIGFSTITIFAGGTKMSANGFTKAEVKQIKEGIEVGKSSTSVNGGQKSVADEIQKLKSLLDGGILTQQEFDTQKAKILGN